MKVVLDGRYLNAPESGIAKYTENLLQNLLKADAENTYGLVTRVPGLAARFDSDRCHDIVYNAPPRSLRTRYALGRRLREVDFDVYHSPCNMLPSGLRHQSVVTIHDVIPLMDPTLTDKDWTFRWTAARFWREAIQYAARHASAIVTISETSSQEIASRFGPAVGARTVVTGSGLDPFFLEGGEDERRMAERIIGGSFPYVLTVGQGSPRKNHVRAVRAFEIAFSQEDAMRFVLVRRLKRRDPEFERVVSDSAIRNRLVVVGHVGNAELRALYRQARAFFFPSLIEGFGLPIIEAMACGCPVVTSETGATAEVAADAAWLCPPLDVGAMADALRAATTEGDERSEKIRKGTLRSAAFDFRQCAERTLEVYRRLVE